MDKQYSSPVGFSVCKYVLNGYFMLKDPSEKNNPLIGGMFCKRGISLKTLFSLEAVGFNRGM